MYYIISLFSIIKRTTYREKTTPDEIKQSAFITYLDKLACDNIVKLGNLISKGGDNEWK